MDAPDIDSLVAPWFFRAFWELSTTRDISMGLGPIPWQYIIQYADRYGLEGEEVAAFIKVIREMDVAYMDWHDENRPSPPAKDP